VSALTDQHPPRYSADVNTLRGAWRGFLTNRSPWIIAAAIAVVAALRIALGRFDWRDLAAVAAMLVIYPFGEWAIHVYLLHLRPFRLRGRRVDLVSARAHREHHEAPNDLSLILLAPLELLALLALAVPFAIAVPALAIGALTSPLPLRVALTAALTGYVLVGLYEWCHYLIHTAHRPRSRYYRSIWRNHRLHHFKNEHYWHGITSNISDRVLGTFPDQREVPRSGTARTLDPGPAG
jgi:hypothetical protein